LMVTIVAQRLSPPPAPQTVIVRPRAQGAGARPGGADPAPATSAPPAAAPTPPATVASVSTPNPPAPPTAKPAEPALKPATAPSKPAAKKPTETALASSASTSAPSGGGAKARSLRDAFPAAKLTSIFDGKSLDGWSADGAKHWSVSGGTLKGRLGPNAADERDFLYTKANYHNFLLTARFRCSSGDAGILLRAKPNSLVGLQLFIGKTKPGALAVMADEAPRGSDSKFRVLVDSNVTAKLFRPEWNEVAISVNNDRIRCEINDQPAFETQYSGGSPGGVISLKLKPGTEIEFKEIKIARLGK